MQANATKVEKARFDVHDEASDIRMCDRDVHWPDLAHAILVFSPAG